MPVNPDKVGRLDDDQMASLLLILSAPGGSARMQRKTGLNVKTLRRASEGLLIENSTKTTVVKYLKSCRKDIGTIRSAQ